MYHTLVQNTQHNPLSLMGHAVNDVADIGEAQHVLSNIQSAAWLNTNVDRFLGLPQAPYVLEVRE